MYFNHAHLLSSAELRSEVFAEDSSAISLVKAMMWIKEQGDKIKIIAINTAHIYYPYNGGHNEYKTTVVYAPTGDPGTGRY